MHSHVIAAGGLLVLAACAAPPAEPKIDMAAALEEIAGASAPIVEPPVEPLESAHARCRREQEGLSAEMREERPVPIYREPAVYPTAALSAELEGSCRVSFEIGGDGLVTPASVIAECTDEVFTASAVRAVERWCFRPAADGAAFGDVQAGLEYHIAQDGPAPAAEAAPR